MDSGLPTLESVREVCHALENLELLGQGAPLPLQRMYAWLWSDCAPQVRRQLVEAGAHTLLVATLSSPKVASRSVELWVCHVLGRVACDDHTALKLDEAGAIEGICQLISRHPANAQVQLAAATALGYLAQCTTLRPKVASSGAVERILQTVEKQLVRPDFEKL